MDGANLVMCRLRATGIVWNTHEPMLGKFDFTGILDLKKCIETARKLGLNFFSGPDYAACNL